MLKILSPNFFHKLEKFLIPILSIILPIVFALGLYYSLFASPDDYQQGQMVRVMYVHVPAAWMSLGVYSFIALCSFSALVWKTRLSYYFAVAAAPIGAGFTLITLITGSLWGKPIWGTWWVWDARLTSMLVLFFIYVSYMLIVHTPDNLARAEKPASVMAIIGFINVPIVKFSVDIWYSLHQPASILRSGGPAIDQAMLKPLFIMFLGYILYFVLALLLGTRAIIEKQKRQNSEEK